MAVFAGALRRLPPARRAGDAEPLRGCTGIPGPALGPPGPRCRSGRQPTRRPRSVVRNGRRADARVPPAGLRARAAQTVRLGRGRAGRRRPDEAVRARGRPVLRRPAAAQGKPGRPLEGDARRNRRGGGRVPPVRPHESDSVLGGHGLVRHRHLPHPRLRPVSPSASRRSDRGPHRPVSLPGPGARRLAPRDRPARLAPATRAAPLARRAGVRDLRVPLPLPGTRVPDLLPRVPAHRPGPGGSPVLRRIRPRRRDGAVASAAR